MSEFFHEPFGLREEDDDVGYDDGVGKTIKVHLFRNKMCTNTLVIKFSVISVRKFTIYSFNSNGVIC
jgi:hypothetical protein